MHYKALTMPILQKNVKLYLPYNENLYIDFDIIFKVLDVENS